MTNLRSITGGTLWTVLSVLLVFAALEPIPAAAATTGGPTVLYVSLV